MAFTRASISRGFERFSEATERKTSALRPSSLYQDLNLSNMYVSTCKRIVSRVSPLRPNWLAAIKIALFKSRSIRRSMIILNTPRLALLSAKGSLDPEGCCPILNIPTKVSNLSAKASVVPTSVDGTWSPENRGRYCSSCASAT